MNGQGIHSAAQAEIGEKIRVRLADGQLEAVVDGKEGGNYGKE